MTAIESASLRTYNIASDALSRGGGVELYARGYRGARLVVAVVTHPTLRRPRFAVGGSIEAACERAARTVARLPGRVL